MSHLFWFFWEIWTLEILSANCLSSDGSKWASKKQELPDAIMSSCTCISQFLIYYRNVTCELEVGNLSWIDSDSLGQWRAHCSMSWSRGWVGHAGQMVNISLKPFIDLQMMEHTWHRATHSIRHLLQPWKFCSTKVRQWCRFEWNKENFTFGFFT